MSLNVWNCRRPVSVFDVLARDFDRMFFELNKNAMRQSHPKYAAPFYEVVENESGYFLSVELPGVSKDELEIEVNENQLRIATSRKEEKEEAARRPGRRWDNFQRSFELPKDADGDRIEARLENGILELAIPKVEQTKPRKIAVNAS